MQLLDRRGVRTGYSSARFRGRYFVPPLAIVLSLVFVALRLNPAKAIQDPIDEFSASRPTRSNLIDLPRVTLWAWERPEDLRFLDTRSHGVAFLARTIQLRSLPSQDDSLPDRGVYLSPRLQPLKVPQETPLIAVVRIESSNDLWHRPVAQQLPREGFPTFPYNDAQREIVARLAADAASLPKVKGLQIDFDASRGERNFFAALLKDVRARMPRGMPLSITALASWCIGDNWLDRLPPGTIDEAVPMLFRMGPEAANVKSYLKSGKDFRSPLCRTSLGVSTDEAFSQALLSGALHSRVNSGQRRIYIFSPKSWVKQDADVISREIERWQHD
jgi:hypothetical protein